MKIRGPEDQRTKRQADQRTRIGVMKTRRAEDMDRGNEDQRIRIPEDVVS